MIFVTLSIVIGLGLGILSAYHTKAFLSALGSSLVVGFILLRPIVAVGASASAASGRDHFLSLYIEGFLVLPIGLQNAVYLFLPFIFIGRLACWIYRCATEPEPEPEIMFANKTAQIISEFGSDHTWAEITKDADPNENGYKKFKAPSKTVFGAPQK